MENKPMGHMNAIALTTSIGRLADSKLSLPSITCSRYG